MEHQKWNRNYRFCIIFNNFRKFKFKKGISPGGFKSLRKFLTNFKNEFYISILLFSYTGIIFHATDAVSCSKNTYNDSITNPDSFIIYCITDKKHGEIIHLRKIKLVMYKIINKTTAKGSRLKLMKYDCWKFYERGLLYEKLSWEVNLRSS